MPNSRPLKLSSPTLGNHGITKKHMEVQSRGIGSLKSET